MAAWEEERVTDRSAWTKLEGWKTEHDVAKRRIEVGSSFDLMSQT
jgi:hypothetical protein